MTSKLAAAPVAWMIGGSIVSCLAIMAVGGAAVTPEVALGMSAPLVSAVITWVVMERTQASAPERLTSVMIAAFGIKMVLMGVYVVVMLAVFRFRAVPFVVSFTSYYLVLHAGKTVLLKRLLAAAGQP